MSMVLWFHRFRGVKGLMVSWCQYKMGLTGLHDSPSRVYFFFYSLAPTSMSERPPSFIRFEGRFFVDFAQLWLLFYLMPVFHEILL